MNSNVKAYARVNVNDRYQRCSMIWIDWWNISYCIDDLVNSPQSRTNTNHFQSQIAHNCSCLCVVYSWFIVFDTISFWCELFHTLINSISIDQHNCPIWYYQYVSLLHCVWCIYFQLWSQHLTLIQSLVNHHYKFFSRRLVMNTFVISLLLHKQTICQLVWWFVHHHQPHTTHLISHQHGLMILHFLGRHHSIAHLLMYGWILKTIRPSLVIGTNSRTQAICMITSLLATIMLAQAIVLYCVSSEQLLYQWFPRLHVSTMLLPLCE